MFKNNNHNYNLINFITKMGQAARKKKKIKDDDQESAEIESKDRHEPIRIPNYTRLYPENVRYFEYTVFLESTENEKPVGNLDMMTLVNNLKRSFKGIKPFKRINNYKIDIIFERPRLANAALTNTSF